MSKQYGKVNNHLIRQASPATFPSRGRLIKSFIFSINCLNNQLEERTQPKAFPLRERWREAPDEVTLPCKKLLCLSLLLALCLLLTGCHGSQDTSEFVIPASFDTTRDYEITFWAKNDTNKTQTAVYEQAIQDFETLYPNIHVNMRLYTDYSRIYNDVVTNIATGTTPNVCITYPDHIATYLTGNHVIAPLDDLFANARYGLGGSELKFDGSALDEIVPQFLQECRIGAHYYALPYMRSTEALYVNKTMVEQLGYTLPDSPTWDFIWEVSDAATAKDEEGNYLVNGQKTMIPFIYKSTDNMMIQMLRQKDAPYSTSAGEIQIFNDVTREMLFTVRDHVATGAFSTFKISSYPGNFLNAGQCIFAVDSTAGASWMGTKAPHMDIAADQVRDFELAVRPIPQFDPAHPAMISQGPSVCVFNKPDAQEVLASWLFTQFLLTDSVQTGYAETEGYVPVTLKAQQSEAYQDYLSRKGEDNDEHYSVKIDAAELLMNNTANTFVTPVFNGSASLRDAAGQLIEETAKAVRRKKTVDDAFIDSLYSQVNSLYRLDQIGGQTGSIEDAKANLGPLPGTAVALLCALIAAWVLMGLYLLRRKLKEKKHK
ncbi:MAG: extracellular solute-binding protein [Clostridia bacterium]|nr:extracellular solute-binding protein [Clostridia bacterium]